MFLPRASIRVLDEETDDGRNTLYFAELTLFMGPLTLAQPGSGTIEDTHGRPWAVELRRDDTKLHAYRLTANGWLEQTTQLPPIFSEEFDEEARRLTAGSDQNARLIVGYEENGITKITRWDTQENAYLQNVTFPGVDPNILMDALVSTPLPPALQAFRDAGGTVQLELAGTGQVVNNSMLPVSDLLIFYLTPDRLNVAYRRQGENYGTEHILFEASEPLILDQAVALTGRYQLLVSSASGAPLGAIDALVSDDYIVAYTFLYNETEPLSVQASGPISGLLESVVLVIGSEEGLTAQASGPISGLRRNVILSRNMQHDLEASAQGPLEGELKQIVVNAPPLQHDLGASAQGPLEGELKQIVVNAPPQTDPLTANAVGPVEGTLKHVNVP